MASIEHPSRVRVPVPRFFAFFGYITFSLAAILFLFEAAGGLYLRVVSRSYRSRFNVPEAVAQTVLGQCRGTGNGGCPSSEDPMLNEMSASPAYESAPWVEEFWREERARYNLHRYRYQPFTIWTAPPWHSKHINADESENGTVRRTVNATGPECAKPVQVWVFGGSTAWSVGSPDSMTLPSYLSRELNAAGRGCFEVTNLGALGYNLNQELILLIQRLKRGRRPDIAVFYDGVNDAYVGGVSPADAAAHENLDFIERAVAGRLHERLLEKSRAFRAVQRLLARRPGEAQWSDELLAQRAKDTLDNYLGNIQVAESLAQAYGFKPFFFWQPALPFGAKPLAPFEKAILDYPILVHFTGEQEGANIIKAVRVVYEEAERRSATTSKFIFLGHVFDPVSEPIYIDWAHVAPRGNEIVACALAAHIREP